MASAVSKNGRDCSRPQVIAGGAGQIEHGLDEGFMGTSCSVFSLPDRLGLLDFKNRPPGHPHPAYRGRQTPSCPESPRESRVSRLAPSTNKARVGIARSKIICLLCFCFLFPHTARGDLATSGKLLSNNEKAPDMLLGRLRGNSLSPRRFAGARRNLTDRATEKADCPFRSSRKRLQQTRSV